MSRSRRLAIRWGIHALERMTLHGVDLEEVREIVAQGERIEDYPGDRPYPERPSPGLAGWAAGARGGGLLPRRGVPDRDGLPPGPGTVGC